jgi:isoleucyl-tRNA synthetase
MPVPEIPQNISFPKEETEILKLWQDLDAFHTSMRISKEANRPEYTFYDGPPFATGLPHYGHILAGTIKDVVTRYAHQTGHHVSRRFGWDCHGLPVEHLIDKKLKIKGRQDVMDMGIRKYNSECRGIVSKYTSEWETIIGRTGRWIDFKDDYKTMEPWYMESVWWVFKTMFDKGLVYRGFRVMAYSTACNTPLSNFEAGLNYKDVSDPSVVVHFPLIDEPDVSMVAWTTTPWTLPSNLALCVNPAFEYIKIRDLGKVAAVKAPKSGVMILLKSRLEQLYPKSKKKGYVKGSEFEILETIKGTDLVGKRYTPLFDYYASGASKEGEDHGFFRILADGYVTDDGGTGVVHQAPAFGEDDHRVCTEWKVIEKGGDLPCPIDVNGRFTEPVEEWKGLGVKEADKSILEALKASGRLVKNEKFVHSYPFCWRSDTPLIYKAVPAWFINVKSIKENLITNNMQTYWVPNNVKEGRFHNWLKDARDWNVSRNRYWGAPLPLWVSDDFEEIVCIGSIDELKELTGNKDITDIHRENIDDLTIESKQGKGKLRRVDEVFDCWFESGSMPYAQSHYPFENKERFEKNFPADFIAEGLDQTRGWFYTLMVISTALFNKPPFKNLVVNGLVLAEDGKKMSKSLQNYPDPNIVMNKHGADALRLYLTNSPVVRAEELRFSEDGVQQVVKTVFLPWFNSFRFFFQNAARLEQELGTDFVPTAELAKASENLMDKWIGASLQGLVKFVRAEMEAYRLYTVMPRLLEFLSELTNWYIRFNRDRMKGMEGSDGAKKCLSQLYEVLLYLSILMAPLTPFFTEWMYQRLRLMHPDVKSATAAVDAIGRAESVHYCQIPEVDPSRLDEASVLRMKVMQETIELGRKARERKTIPLKTPIKEILVVCSDKNVLSAVESLGAYVSKELNAKKLTLVSDEDKWCNAKVMPNSNVLGKKLGKAFGPLRKAFAKLSIEEVADLKAKSLLGAVNIGGQALEPSDLVFMLQPKFDAETYEGLASADGRFMILIDITKDESIILEACSREMTNRVQKLRKSTGLQVADKVTAYVSDNGGDGSVFKALQMFKDGVRKQIGLPLYPASFRPKHGTQIGGMFFVCIVIFIFNVALCVSYLHRHPPCATFLILSFS